MPEMKVLSSINKIRNSLLVKIPSDTNDDDIDILQSTLLNYLEKYEVHGVILDLSQVEIVDSFFARTIAETTHMIGLMGIQTVITGMRPNIAITTVELGFDLGNARFALDIDKGFELLDLINYQKMPTGRKV